MQPTTLLSSMVRSYYRSRAPAVPLRPPLLGELRCDVAVVGGGIAGCSAALTLARRGYRVALLEAAEVGSGASGRSGGQFLPGFACGQGTLGRLVGADRARHLFDLSRQGLALVERLIREERIDCERVPGHLQVAVTLRHREALHLERDELAAAGCPDLSIIERAELRSIIASDRYQAALHDPHAFHGNPLLFVHGLAAAAERAGAAIFENTPVLRLASGDAVTLATERGSVRAAHVILAGNALLGALAPKLMRRILRVGTFIIATAPLDPGVAESLIRNDAAVADCNRVLDYYRRSRDHRLLFGGRAGQAGFDAQRLAARTRERMLRVFPQLRAIPVDYAWGGLVDVSLNRAPDFGRLAANVYYLQGFSGHGLVLATLGGELAAEAVAGQAERFDTLARIPHRSLPVGGQAADALVGFALLWNRLLDALG